MPQLFRLEFYGEQTVATFKGYNLGGMDSVSTCTRTVQ